MLKISVALCTFNGQEHISRQLQSISSQSCPPYEICVGDDGSSDQTLNLLAEFAQTAPFAVHIVANKTNLGYGENFIQTAKRCSGDWIAFCDQDDVWLADKLRKCAELIEDAPPGTVMVAHNAIIVNDKGQIEGDIFGQIRWSTNGVRLFEKLELPAAWMMHGNCLVFAREIVTDVPTNDRAWPWRTYVPHDAHDAWIPIIASALGKTIVTTDSLIEYHRHSTNCTVPPAPLTWKQRLKSKLSIEKEYLEFRAFQLEYLADRLATRAVLVKNMSYQRDLSVASNKYTRLALLYRLRQNVTNGPSVVKRLKSVFRLVQNRCYSGQQGWSFGKCALIKDIVLAISKR